MSDNRKSSGFVVSCPKCGKQSVFREMCRKTGKYVRQTPPFGYVYSEESKRLVIDTSVEPYVRLVFAWTLAGIQRSVIAQRMEILNAPTAKSKDSNIERPVWTRETVRAILTNPVYAGYQVMGKSTKSLSQGVALWYKKREDWLIFPDYHEAYISKSDYKRIEDIISQNITKRNERNKRNAEYIEQMTDCFPRMVYCANCGRLMNFSRGSHHRDYSNRSFQSYRCHNDKKNPLCSNMLVQQNYLKIVVMDQMKGLIQTAIDKRKLISEVQKHYEKPSAIHPIERNIHRLEEKENNLDERLLQAYTDFADGLLDEDACILVKSNYMAEKERTDLSKKLTSSHSTKWKNGVSTSGLAPYGYPLEWQNSIGLSHAMRKRRDRITESITEDDICIEGNCAINPLIGEIPTKQEAMEELEALLIEM